LRAFAAARAFEHALPPHKAIAIERKTETENGAESESSVVCALPSATELWKI
jgi:hypothetical protein